MTRPLSDHPEAVRSRRRHAALKRELFRILGNECEHCGVGPNDAKLEPHHITSRTWRSRDHFTITRILLYIEDAIEGRVRLLCSDCNKIEGRPEDDTF